MATDIDWCKQLLLSTFPRRENVRPDGSRKGVRLVKINGDTVESPDRFTDRLEMLQEALPKDVSIASPEDAIMFRVSIGAADFMDAFWTVFRSAEWNGPIEGGLISEVVIRAHEDPEHRGHYKRGTAHIEVAEDARI